MSGTRLSRIALAGIALVFLALSIQEIRSADFWWQLRTGQWIVAHHALPRVDEWTYTVRGHEWIEVRWLFFTLTYLGWAAGGPALLILGQTAILALAFVALVRPVRQVVLELPGQVVLLLGIATASGRCIVRPEIASFLLVSVFLVLLEGDRRDRHSRGVWALPVLQVLWNGLHTLFVLGPVLCFIFAIFERRRRTALVALAVGAAAFVNAYGLRGALFPVLLFREIHAGTIVGRTIEELRSPFALEHWSWDLRAGAALVVLSGLTFVLNRKRTCWPRLAVWGAFSYLAAQSQRNVALLAFAAVWAGLGNLAESKDEIRLPRRAAAWGTALLIVFSVFATWYVASDRYGAESGARRFGLGVDPWYQPQAAVAFLERSRAAPQLFHAMSDGSYLDWAAEERFPVFIDGRNELYDEAFLAEYLEVADGSRDWEVFADRFGINSVMLHREHLARLVEQVRRSPRFVLVHVDPRSSSSCATFRSMRT
jgi:hypothetical protein